MTQKKILVVEDDDANRQLLVDTLKETADVDVDGARDGVEALHRVTTDRYAVVVLDVMMPHMTGIDFLDSLKAMQADPSVKGMPYLPSVLVVTGASADHIPNGALEHRFPEMVRQVLRKPLDVPELVKCVRVLLG